MAACDPCPADATGIGDTAGQTVHANVTSAETASADRPSDESAFDAALLADLREHGALINAVPQLRPDGVRGLVATTHLCAQEMACWIPNSAVLELSTCDAALQSAIAETLEDGMPGAGGLERAAYSRMMALATGLLLERARGSTSRFHRYIEALPEYPPTVNTFSSAERQILAVMNKEADHFAMYTPLVNLSYEVVRRGAALWEGLAVPTREDVEAAFYFVFSRMSHMRMIPLVDLANAALPNEENARILVEDQVVDGRQGCAVVTKKPVAAGEELVIDYQHRNAIGMLIVYGCTLGMEKSVSCTKLGLNFPPWLHALGGARYAGGVQLHVDEPSGIEDEALTLLCFAALGSTDELVLALQAKYFQDPPPPLPCTHENKPKWDASQRALYIAIAESCSQRCKEWEEKLGPLLVEIDTSTLAGQVIISQYDTDIRLLKRCIEAMQAKAAALEVKTDSPEKPVA